MKLMMSCTKEKNIRSFLHSTFYILPVFFISCCYTYAANTDTIIANGTTRTLENQTFENGTNGAYIIQGRQGADITATDIELNSSGTLGGGIWLQSSKLNADDLHINVSGSSANGLYLANDSVATLNNLNIAGTGNAVGVVLDGTWSMPQGLTTAAITEGTVSTAAGDAFRVMAGELTLNNLSATTQGSSSYAVNANTTAKVTIEGGSFATQGLYSDAIWVASQDSLVTLNNVTVTTQGDRASAVNAQRGTAKVTKSHLETKGENAYGIYTQNRVEGEDLTIATSGLGGVGMFVALGGQGTLNNSTITTQGELGAGLVAYPGSAINADHVVIETAGVQGFGLWDRVGTLNVSNSTISTSGEAASGIFADGYSSDPLLKNVITLDKVMLNTLQAEAVQVDTTRLSLAATDSTLSGGNGTLMTVTGYDDPADAASNLYSNVTFDAINSVLEGDILVSNPLNSLAVTLSSGSALTGAVTNATSLSLDNSSHWVMSGNSSVGELTNNGTITFSDLNNFDSLTVTGNYAGDGGLLIMNSVLGDDTSPANKLLVGGDVLAGTTRVTMNNLGGQGAQTVEGIEVVNVGGTSIGSFVKSGRIVAGAYDYDLVKNGQNWYLTSQAPVIEPPAEASVPATPATDTSVPQRSVPSIPASKAPATVRPEGGSYIANLAAANTLFMMTLHDRQGETQFVDALTGKQEVTSLWLRQVGGHNKWRDGSNQLKTQSNRYMTQIGGDIARWSTNGADRWHTGFMTGYANNHSATESHVSGYRSEGEVKGYSIGGYATWYANQDDHTGVWLDSWLQYSWFDNEVRGEHLATENYKSHGFTASLESGYTWKLAQFQGSQGSTGQWFIQPQAQAVWMGVRADDHQEANGTRIRGEGDGNLMTRLGLRTWLKGHHASDEGKQREFQPYVAVNWLHNTRNFSTSMDGVQVSQNGATNLGEMKVGLEGQLNPRLNVWGNIGVQVGDKGYNDAAALVGLKYHF